jgi:uncharacterized membrane protein YhaH (DUF805 family)
MPSTLSTPHRRRLGMGGTMDLKYLLTSFEGRINRAKYWACSCALIVVQFAGGMGAAALDDRLGTRLAHGPGALFMIYWVACWYVAAAVNAKRWHDRGKSGWWSLIVVIPVIGGLWIFAELGVLAGTRGPNRFGADPIG